MIYGPPGTGKSSFLLRQAKATGGQVTFCSHTRTAAKNAVAMMGETPLDWSISTVHSLCFKALGLSRAQVVSQINLASFCKRAGFENDPGSDDKPTTLRFYLHAHSYAEVTGIRYHEAFEKCGAQGSRVDFERFCITYKQWKDAYGFVDFSDMLFMCAERGFVANFGTLCVDEAQDLTPLHWRVIKQMLPHCTRLLIAGDDDQSIFQWSGADPHGMMKFAEKEGCEVKVLDQSYRVPRAVHAMAEGIADRLLVRQQKSYKPRDADGEVDSSALLSKSQLRSLYATGSLMILFRNRYARTRYERMLMEELVPYVTDVSSSPLQTRAGKAFIRLRRGLWHDGNDVRVIRAALTPYGTGIADKSGYQAVADRIDGDLCTNVLGTDHRTASYLQGVKLDARPVDIRTIHAAKGMEADSVIVVSSMTRSSLATLYTDPDSEHRVAYVSATRAKQRLLIIRGDKPYPYPLRDSV